MCAVKKLVKNTVAEAALKAHNPEEYKKKKHLEKKGSFFTEYTDNQGQRRTLLGG